MDRIQFKINKKEYFVGGEVSSDTTLLDFIRSKLQLFGTKYMCHEGSCGTCIVAASQGCGAKATAVNSCMISITSCHNWNITTIEGLSDRHTGYHVLQTTLAESNGSQCGYCSPGWIMAMYSLLQSNPSLTMLDIEGSFGSNICRCTGYRPILEAFKKFGKDAPSPITIPDIEDLDVCQSSTCENTRCKEYDWCIVSKEDVLQESMVHIQLCKEYDWCIVSKEDVLQESMVHIQLCDERDWYRPLNLSNLFQVLDKRGQKTYMLVGGNTAKGPYPIHKYPQLLIDMSAVNELKGFKLEQNLVLGAATTFTEALDIFEKLARTDSNFSYLQQIYDHVKLIAHIAVRNVSFIEFDLEYELQKNIAKSLTSRKILTMVEFLNEDMSGEIILNILLPPLAPEYKLITYKIMPRSQNVHAIINAGFLYRLNSCNEVMESRVVYGGLSPSFSRCMQTESYLRGRQLFVNETLQSAVQILDQELLITRVLPELSIEYRRRLAVGLFYKGLMSICPRNILNPRYHSGPIRLHESRPVSSGTQVYKTNTDLWPLNQPITKIEALLQCSGEAMYTEDVPPLKDEVFIALALSNIAHGTIESIDPTEALKEQGVVAFYSYKDVPGFNSFTPVNYPGLGSKEEIVCDGTVSYFNQPIGIIVANNRITANRAAKLVTATYKNNNKTPSIFIKQAMNDRSRVTLYSKHLASHVGTDVIKVFEGTHVLYQQIHFSMEILACVSQLSEVGLKVRATSQFLASLQAATSQALLVDQNKIDIYVDRLGGGFGFKMTRLNQGGVACNLAALKLKRPCRFIQTQSTNSRALGKRFPCVINFEVGVNMQGVIQYMTKKFYEDNGYVTNEKLIFVSETMYNNCYNKTTWTYESYDVVTNTASNSWFRCPGTLEQVANTEMIMEQISYELGLNPINVRLNNLDKENYGIVEEMWKNVKVNSEYDKRRTAVDLFNLENRWKKRGLRTSFMRWDLLGRQNNSVNISAYYGDGTVIITHGGVDMGQGLNTKAIQICAYYLKIPVNMIQVKTNSTITAPNVSETAASATSHNVGVGVRKCCETLLARLEPLKRKMYKPTWQELLKAAFEDGVDLQTHASSSVAEFDDYNACGIAVAEVEIDILTGEHELIRVDLLEDVGLSLAPKIDVDQLEGAFVMGLGYWTCEKMEYEPTTGEVLSDRPWNYWFPLANDIPQDFRIYFLERSYGPKLYLGAKATGEPATSLAVAVPLSMREAITSARLDSGIPSNEWYSIDGPYAVEQVCLATATNIKDFKFY